MYRRRVTSSNAGGGGIGFCGALTLIFIVLKLVGVIDWSWIWVLSPIWITLGLALLAFLIAFIVVLIKTLIQNVR